LGFCSSAQEEIEEEKILAPAGTGNISSASASSSGGRGDGDF
jgi:hypothetical protein